MIKPNESNCSGCRSCEQVCPLGCITIESNKNGFLIPNMNTKNCIQCGLCEKICPISTPVKLNNVSHTLAAFSTDVNTQNSTSGGIFYVLAFNFIKRGGIVYGAMFDTDMYLKINEAKTQKQLQALQGSKYFQADTQDTFRQVKEYLKCGTKVLYSGTPCQIAGLKAFLGGLDTNNLLTVEIICHGTPSPKMFKDYIVWLEVKKGKKVDDLQFRTKKANDKDFRCFIKYTDNTSDIISGFRDPFFKKFLDRDSYREICYECPFAQQDRVSDITLGDFWNIEEVDLNFGGRERVSVVLINSNIGMKYWKEISKNVVQKEVDWNMAVKGNSDLERPSYKLGNYFPYGEIKDTNMYFDEVFKKRGYIKKEVLNFFPTKARKRVKRFFIVLNNCMKKILYEC